MARQEDKKQKLSDEGSSRVKTHTIPAKSRGVTMGSISRKVTTVPTARPLGTPARKSASINAGKKLPQQQPTTKR